MPSYPELSNKTVLVTGASGMLGAAAARAFAAAGCKTVVHGRNLSAIAKVTDAITVSGAPCIGIAADATCAAELAAMRAEITTNFGAVDILAAFAGGMGQPIPALDMREEQFRQVLESDLTSKFLAARTFAPAMRAQGSGNIIFMSSTAGRQCSQASAAYGAAQAGCLMLMRHLAQELGPAIRVNAIAPSLIPNAKHAIPQPALAQIAAGFPLRRVGTPQDVAEAALFLASDAAAWITGQVLDVNGGKIMP